MNPMTIDLVTLSFEGLQVLHTLRSAFPNSRVYVHSNVETQGDDIRFDSLQKLVAEIFSTTHAMVFVAPCGAVVRSIAPHLKHKTLDPAVVVVDVTHRHAISLVSGHEGGANLLAVEVGNALSAEPVITTTTEARKRIIAGVGCRKGTAAERIIAALTASLSKVESDYRQLRLIASITHKAAEPGLLEAARLLGVPLRWIQEEEIRAWPLRFTKSEAAAKHLGLDAVAEPCALLAGRRTRFILSKTKYEGVTVALAREQCLWSESDPGIPWTGPIKPNEP